MAGAASGNGPDGTEQPRVPVKCGGGAGAGSGCAAPRGERSRRPAGLAGGDGGGGEREGRGGRPGDGIQPSGRLPGPPPDPEQSAPPASRRRLASSSVFFFSSRTLYSTPRPLPPSPVPDALRVSRLIPAPGELPGLSHKRSAFVHPCCTFSRGCFMLPALSAMLGERLL